MIKHALLYAQRGWHVMPLQPRGKTPLTTHGVNDATTDPGVIRAWWARWPRANIGIACGPSGLVVIDIDRRDDPGRADTFRSDAGRASTSRASAGRDGVRAWRALYRQYYLCIPETVTARTGGGGYHLLYLAPPEAQGLRIGNSSDRLGPGLDVRAEGGYIVAPPSVHPSGRRYAWSAAHHPDRCALAPLPEPVIERLSLAGAARRIYAQRRVRPLSPRCISKAVEGILRRLELARTGNRNSLLYWSACRLFEHGFALNEVEALLVWPALRVGLREGETAATIRSAQKQSQGGQGHGA